VQNVAFDTAVRRQLPTALYGLITTVPRRVIRDRLMLYRRLCECGGCGCNYECHCDCCCNM